MIYFIVFFISSVLTILFVPFAKKSAFLLNAIDKPSDRKVHKSSMPRLGGLAIYLGFMAAVLTGLLIAVIRHMHLNYLAITGILLGSSLMLIVGMFDDMKNIPATKKLLLQILISLVPIMFGVQITFISNPVTGILLLGFISVPVTILWVVGITNALNFVDGLDGLASGITAIAATTLFIVAVRIHQPGAAILMIALAGATAGFLRYNFNPASIFLGDSGSLFLGFMLATCSVIGVLKSSMILALLIPAFIMGIPIFDAASVIMRRVRDGRHIFDADRRHLHHRLLDRGFSHRQVVLSIYSACILLSIGTLAVTFLRVSHALVVLGIVAIIVFTVFYQIKKYVRKYVVLEK
ncbi:MAG: MraY family glycosyltransferase [Candidatus Saganbacteria bacterium]|nr:MraY family glycosyltransferase [Candidatus Saganbacteria bacterium]